MSSSYKSPSSAFNPGELKFNIEYPGLAYIKNLIKNNFAFGTHEVNFLNVDEIHTAIELAKDKVEKAAIDDLDKKMHDDKAKGYHYGFPQDIISDNDLVVETLLYAIPKYILNPPVPTGMSKTNITPPPRPPKTRTKTPPKNNNIPPRRPPPRKKTPTQSSS